MTRVFHLSVAIHSFLLLYTVPLYLLLCFIYLFSCCWSFGLLTALTIMKKKIAMNILVHLLMDISTHSPLGMELLDHLSLYICLDLANVAKLFFKVFVPKFWSLGQPTLAPTSDFPPDQPACVAIWIYPCHSFCINTCPNSKFSHFGFIEL